MISTQISAPPLGLLATAAPGITPGVSAGSDTVLLRAAFGQDEANHGTDRYMVDNERLVRVPLVAVGPLITIGGFVLMKTSVDASSAGALNLHHDDASGCSYAGRQYLGDENGDVLVPAEAGSELSAHGFVPVVREAAARFDRKMRRGANRSIKG